MRAFIAGVIPFVLAASAGCSISTGYVNSTDRSHSIDVMIPANAPGIKSDYGARRGVNGKCCRDFPHNGIDIVAPRGYPVIAPADGRVSFVGENSRWGKHISIIHSFPEGWTMTTSYQHLSSVDVAARERVARGQKVGEIGQTGSTSGGVNHLHFSVSHGNPHYYWIGGRGIIECFDAGKTYLPKGDAMFTYPVACVTE